MEVRENLIKLCEKINGGHYKITPDCAEYKVFEQWITDEQITVMLALTDMKPAFVPIIARKAGMSVKRTREVLHECYDIGLVVQVVVPKVGLEIYLLPPYTPGIFEFLLINEKFCLAHPEIAYAFHQHATTSQIEHAPNTPMGAGIMRVIPIESAIPADAQQIDNERVSKYLEENEGHLSITPCQCRRVRKFMNEGSGDLDEGLCIFMGHVGDMFNRSGKGRPCTVEEAKALVKKCDERGCVHQITTLHQGETFAICNCMPESCLALGVSQYYNTPATSRSNYVAEIDEAKCVACGQCTDRCANNAIQMGQKLCAKTPIVHEPHEVPDDIEWTPEHWNPEHRTNREYVAPEGTAPCKTACPAHIAVQGYIKLAAQGKYLEALELIKKENPLPAVCGRVCNRKCEDVCTRGDIDRAVAIDEVKKFIADKELERDTRFVPKKLYDFSDKKIAVIGAGPAGLSCAYYLAADNYRVTVFDKNEQPGGMLRYGIPSFRLEKPVLDAEIDVLKELGVIFRCGVEIGKDVTIQELRDQGYNAFYLAVGAQKSASLGIPGEDLKGVWGGIDFLREVNSGARPALGKKVVVVGGGNVAMDVARTAVRLGAQVTVAYRRKESDMPADPAEVAEAKEEGVKFLFEHKPVEIEGKNGKVTALACEGDRLIKCDAILAAIGQRIELDGLDLGELKVDEKGRVLADEVTYQTSQPDIFVGGDAHTGPKFAIDAIAQGKQAAISIHRFVQPGQSLTIGRDRLTYRAFDKENVDFDTVKRSADATARQIPGKDEAKASTFKDDRKTFTEEQLKAETARCLGCGASFVDPNKCLGCGVCTTRCKFDAIHLKKRYFVESIDYFDRPKELPIFMEGRRKRIEIRKMQEAK
ncbi:MAG: FAD-dependent oxidoreductase [Oscillospiraceae bacterium]|nr:FAD-dependent oxidoreductase [Oscillospiraceae bacterium]